VVRLQGDTKNVIKKRRKRRTVLERETHERYVCLPDKVRKKAYHRESDATPLQARGRKGGGGKRLRTLGKGGTRMVGANEGKQEIAAAGGSSVLFCWRRTTVGWGKGGEQPKKRKRDEASV